MDSKQHYFYMPKSLRAYISPRIAQEECGMKYVDQFAGEMCYEIIDMKKFLAARLKYGF